MVSRIQNRNTGYSDSGLFSNGTITQNNSVNNSISGATVLKLEDQFEATSEAQESFETDQQTPINSETSLNLETNEENLLGNANQHLAEESLFEVDSIEQVSSNNEAPLTLEEEYTPKLFSDETNLKDSSTSETEEQKLFDQEKNQEDDFEIPAFLRRQKF
jgi:hypothetical protein